MSKRQLYHLWDFVSRVAGMIPPIAVAMYFYPIWIEEGSRPVVSGTLIITALVAAIPFIRKIKNIMNYIMNASMPILWMIGLCLSYVLMNVADQLFFICAGGLAGSVISAGLCLIRNKYKEDKSEGITYV